MYQVVVDTNVLMSGSAWSGTASRLVDALLAGEAILCLSPNLLAELSRDSPRHGLYSARHPRLPGQCGTSRSGAYPLATVRG